VVTELALAGAAALGAASRYAADRLMASRFGARLPWGTLLVNLAGCLLLGLLTGAGLHHGLGAAPRRILGTGFCGALTTFSAFSVETLRLAGAGRYAYLALSVGGGLFAAAGGLWLAAP